MAPKSKWSNETILTCLTAVLLTAAVPASAGIIYVDAASLSVIQDGTSWCTAVPDLQAALLLASSGDVIRMAHGTYTPDASDRTVSYVLKNGVNIEGGYAGRDACVDPGTRDFAVYETILSGDLLNDDQLGNFNDNSYHVIDCPTDFVSQLQGLTISGGRASLGDNEDGYGGGIRNGYLNLSSVWILGGTLTLDNCKFINNAANRLGGGMSNVGHPATLTNCTFTSNSTLTSTEGGGAFTNKSVFLPGDTDSEFTDCVFTSNTSMGAGGAFFGSGTTTVSFTRCTFDQNSSSESGGAVELQGSAAIVNNCYFTNNTGSVGGALSGGNDSAQAVAITGTTFTGNGSTLTDGAVGGGAIWSGGNVNLSGCTFDSNASAEDGGAVYIYPGSGTPVVQYAACIFDGNTAVKSGGAVYEENGAVAPTYLNSLFVINKAMGFTGDEGGGAIFSGGSTNAPYINCTFVANEARTGQGGGIRVRDDQSPVVTNCIFWDNCVASDCLTQDEDAQIHISGTNGNGDSVTFSTIEGCTDPGFCPSGTTNTATEPIFVGTGSHPYQLQDIAANVPLIDFGDNAESDHQNMGCRSVNTTFADLAGNTRFIHKAAQCGGGNANVVDMGAYEVQ